MTADSTPIDGQTQADAPAKRAGKQRLLSLGDLDKRTSVYRQVAETIDKVEADLGGADRLSEAQRSIVRHAVLSGAMADSLATQWLGGAPIDPSAFATICNSMRRLYAEVGIRKTLRDVTPPSLAEYVASKAREVVE